MNPEFEYLKEKNYSSAKIVSKLGYSIMLEELYGVECNKKALKSIDSKVALLEFKYKLDKSICNS